MPTTHTEGDTMTSTTDSRYLVQRKDSGAWYVLDTHTGTTKDCTTPDAAWLYAREMNEWLRRAASNPRPGCTLQVLRRDQVRPGMLLCSSHGYTLLVTDVIDTAVARTDERHVEIRGHLHGLRHVEIRGHLHGLPASPIKNERYPAGSQVPVWVQDCSTATGRLAAVAAAFEPAFGELYVDEMHVEPLWDMAAPSVDTVLGDPDGGNQTVVDAEVAKRVAAAIALLAYGVEAIEAKAGLL